jgi:thiol:disulfide interchange protein DsbD
MLPIFAAGPARAEASFLEPEEAFTLTVDESRGAERLSLNWAIAPGYYLYRDRLAVTAGQGSTVGNIVRPAGESKADPNFGVVEVYHGKVSMEVDAAHAKTLAVSWQGCADAGLCYPPQKRTVVLNRLATSNGSGAAMDSQSRTQIASASDPGTSSDSGISQLLVTRTLWWTLPLFFVLGIALAFTPCVLPMVPIVSGIVVGSQATPRRAFALALSFVIAMAGVYALLGVGAAISGSGLQSLLQNRWAILAFSAVFVVLALAMFGLFELQLPSFLRDRLAGAGPRRGGGIGAAVGMGALSALLVGPCMTAPLAGTLIYIAQSGNVAQGGVLLFALGLGMGLPLLVLSTFGARYLPRPGPWMEGVKGAFGFLLLGTAAWMAQRVLPAPLSLLLWGGLLMGAALALWRLAVATRATVIVRCAALLAGLWASALVVGAAAGATDPLQPLAVAMHAGRVPQAPAGNGAAWETIRDPALLQARLDTARDAGKPALVDFSADWCTSCKTIDKEVFGDPLVRDALAGVVLLRADVTAGDASQQALMQHYQVMGPPTVLIFARDGRERRASRLVGEFDARQLLQLDPAGSKS